MIESRSLVLRGKGGSREGLQRDEETVEVDGNVYALGCGIVSV